MVTACIERVIDVPIERAWEIFSDFSHVHRIHPMVGTVEQITPEKDRGLGAIRQCNLYDGHVVQEKIVAWDEENRIYTVEMTQGDLPLKTAVATLSAESVGQGKTKLLVKMNLKAKYGVLGTIMEHLFMKPQLGGAVGDLLDGVEKYSKTGQEIPRGYKAKTRALMTAC